MSKTEELDRLKQFISDIGPSYIGEWLGTQLPEIERAISDDLIPDGSYIAAVKNLDARARRIEERAAAVEENRRVVDQRLSDREVALKNREAALVRGVNEYSAKMRQLREFVRENGN